MSISRVTKAIAEIRRDSKFQCAESVRDVSFDLLVQDTFSREIQCLAQIAVALALRCFKGRIRIHKLNDAPDLNHDFRDSIESQAKKFGEEHRLDFAPSERGPWSLALGCTCEGVISVDSSGWTARINGVFRQRLPAAPSALAFAVACAFAKLFNQAILGGGKHVLESWDFCLLRFLSGENPPLGYAENIHIGKVGLLGAGAIGSSVGYILALSQSTGTLNVIDFDYYEEPNLETCLDADRESVNVPLRKASSLVNSFADHSISAIERRCELKAGDPLLSEEWDAFICAVDNSDTRQLLDNVNARVLINGGLGSSKEDAGWILWTRHCKGDRPLSEIYKKPQEGAVDVTVTIPDEFQDECSRMHYKGVSLSLPFAALATGSLLVASLYQNATKTLADAAYLQMDLFAKQQRMTRM